MKNKMQGSIWTPLLKIRDLNEHKVLPAPKRIIDKFSASVSVGSTPDLPALYYITNAMVAAEFREINSNEFKINFLAPLDTAIRESDICDIFSSHMYAYPVAESKNEEWIQRYFNGRILAPVETLYQSICGRHHVFGGSLTVKPSFTNEKNLLFKPDTIHYLTNKLASLYEFPHIYFGLGDYKTESYCLPQGFGELKAATKDYKHKLSSTRMLRKMKAPPVFEN